MTKLILRADCGNSPKNLLLQKLTVAIAKRDVKFILQSVTDDIEWCSVGDKTIMGKEALAKALKQFAQVSELKLEQVISHGKAGAVNGTRKMTNGKVFAFCEIYEFSNAKGTQVSKITTYAIQPK